MTNQRCIYYIHSRKKDKFIDCDKCLHICGSRMRIKAESSKTWPCKLHTVHSNIEYGFAEQIRNSGKKRVDAKTVCILMFGSLAEVGFIVERFEFVCHHINIKCCFIFHVIISTYSDTHTHSHTVIERVRAKNEWANQRTREVSVWPCLLNLVTYLWTARCTVYTVYSEGALCHLHSSLPLFTLFAFSLFIFTAVYCSS